MMTISPAIQELRQNPFFVLSGPQGRPLSCQWTAWNGRDQRAFGCEFEIITPETPDAMGCLFGLFEDGSFRMRPAVRETTRLGKPSWTPAPELDLDLAWRGSIDDVLEVGHDWRLDDDGTLSIEDPEEPAWEGEDVKTLRRAA